MNVRLKVGRRLSSIFFWLIVRFCLSPYSIFCRGITVEYYVAAEFFLLWYFNFFEWSNSERWYSWFKVLSHICECPCKYAQRCTSFSFYFYPYMYQLSKSIHYHWIEIFKMSYGKEKMQQNAHGMYLRSLNSGLTTTIYFYHIRRTFHSLTGTCYSGSARTALLKSYKIQATLLSILHSLPLPLLSLLRSLSHCSLPGPSSSTLSSSLNAIICRLWRGKPLNIALYDERDVLTIWN